MTTSPRPKAPPLVRLLPMVRRDNASGCWNYTGYLTPAGYGQFFDGEHRNAFSHRVMYEQTRGPIPPGAQLDHLCRNRRCCNPFHLEIVSRRENLNRGNGFSGVNVRVTQCPQGHPYDEANTYHRPDGKGRDCKICRARRLRSQGKKNEPFTDRHLLRDVRLVRGWTQREIAEYVGLDGSNVGRIEAGKRTEVDPEVFVLLSALLDEFRPVAENEQVSA